jgi:hypothetical protein
VNGPKESDTNKLVESSRSEVMIFSPSKSVGWDSLLTELRASGLILRDGDDVISPKEEEGVEEEVDDDSSCSYGSASFDSSFESEEE